MTNIELVIKIPEKDYDDILNGEVKASAINWSTFNAIRNGISLPKGHGDLVDIDEIWHLYDYSDIDYTMIDAVKNASTIIEADNAESEV